MTLCYDMTTTPIVGHNVSSVAYSQGGGGSEKTCHTPLSVHRFYQSKSFDAGKCAAKT